MFKPSYDEELFMSKQEFAVKYLLPFVIFLTGLMLVGQLIAQLFTINQLNRASGTVTDMDLKVDYLTHRRKNVPPHAVYSLFITIDSNKMFNIENRAFMRKVNKQVHKGDHITVYYPTGIYKILCFGFAHKANQLDLSNRVIFDFSNEKKQAWSLIEIDLVVIGLSCYLWFYLRKGIIQSQ